MFDELTTITHYLSKESLTDIHINFSFSTPYIHDFKYHSGVSFWIGVTSKKSDKFSYNVR